MQNFNYYAPTKVVFGKDTEKQVGELVKEQQCKKVLVHFGGQSAKKSGLLDRICNSLTETGINYVTLGGVVPNPRLSLVREGIELCKQEGVDFILAVGGGSVIDSAKAIGYGMTNKDENGQDVDVWDLYLKKFPPKACLPIGAVLTIAAAGSEMSDSSVITNEDGWLKRGLSSNYARCKFAVMNPELTYSLPKYQTMCGCTDILMHTMERYFTKEEHTELTDELAEGLMRSVIQAAKTLLVNPNDYNARAQVMWAGSLSHNGLTGCGTVGDWACHQLEHELGGMFDVAHGAGLAAVWGSWARYVYSEKPERFAQFAVKVLGIKNSESQTTKKPTGKEAASQIEETALAGIAAMEAFYREIEMPTTIEELGIEVTPEQLDELAYKCAYQGTRTIGGFRVLHQEDMKKIYENALK
ncbi:MAG: iron-containing alcohol dehydrogenase [Lachnospiraceae bacterium]|nr:iron-containing alcohol dehydrogenase [Lachnospiraceae bacterium]